MSLPQSHYSLLFTLLLYSEFSNDASTFAPNATTSISTSVTNLIRATLQGVSGGTSYRWFRLAFHPYTHVTRTICTSETLRTSTPRWKSFILHRYRSINFGLPINDLFAVLLLAFATASPFLGVNLAIYRSSLERFSKRTARRRLKTCPPYIIITTRFQNYFNSI